jgi:NAD(P)-dependent dehydrogenase (short-subunit alcohol dehydrogenase family)
MPVAIITGASRGLGEALARGLAERGWSLVVDARGAEALERVRAELHAVALEHGGQVVAVLGDVTDGRHRQALADAAEALGGAELVVNNASVLGPSPQPALASYPLDVLATVYRVNVLAPLGVVQATHDQLRRHGGAVLNITSDAGVEAHEGWGGYGSSKAALEQLSAVLAAETPDLAVWWVDPGDLRTQMHAEAFPGEDISDRPLPETVVPALLHLIERRLPSGRYRAAQLLEAVSTGALP